MIEPVCVSVVVPLARPRAFDRFVRELNAWWPREYTWSQDVLHTIGVHPQPDGLCFEIGPHEFRCDWGRVLDWAPPDHVRLAWQISPRREPVPNPLHASSLAVSFASEGPHQTIVTVVHDAFDRHGSGAEDYRAMMASRQGWPLILQRFVQAAM
jgi:uncharacterized protein YndB with AHSA1/START domain